ncbi:penicillin-binding protein activator [Marimonas arenosa]|uniref:Penicillin-binding protein activator n=1 Tax=Marimonas arenosa TaxID=1795305 RepID=A0AAE3WIK7_9RHOB|nr:penicillin-binding protein activator [Marimonas arenosa]MDQ2092143.1 penicillin-binding protein activator [Marimonas arenosa]
MFAVLSPIRKSAARLLALTSVLWLAACQPVAVGGGGGPRINPTAPVPVALLVPHGSSSSGDTFLATALENAARMGVSDLDGVRIDLRVYPTAGNAAQAQQAASKAVAEGAKIILGPVFAEAANAAGVAAAPRGVNVLAFSNNPTIAGGNVYILGQTFDTTANRLTAFARRQGKARIVVLHSDNVAGQLGRAAIERAIAAQGATLAGTVAYEFSQQGVVNAIPRVKSAATTGQANAVFMTANTAGALPLFAQMLPEAGLSPASTQYIGLTRWDIPPQTLELPGVQGGWFALPDPGKTQAFSSHYQARFGETPPPIAGLAYDGIAAIGALVKAGKADALTGAALTQGAGFQGATGIFRLRPDGTNQRGLAVAQIRDRQVVVVDPAPSSFGGAGF